MSDDDQSSSSTSGAAPLPPSPIARGGSGNDTSGSVLLRTSLPSPPSPIARVLRTSLPSPPWPIALGESIHDSQSDDDESVSSYPPTVKVIDVPRFPKTTKPKNSMSRTMLPKIDTPALVNGTWVTIHPFLKDGNTGDELILMSLLSHKPFTAKHGEMKKLYNALADELKRSEDGGLVFSPGFTGKSLQQRYGSYMTFLSENGTPDPPRTVIQELLENLRAQVTEWKATKGETKKELMTQQKKDRDGAEAIRQASLWHMSVNGDYGDFAVTPDTQGNRRKREAGKSNQGMNPGNSADPADSIVNQLEVRNERMKKKEENKKILLAVAQDKIQLKKQKMEDEKILAQQKMENEKILAQQKMEDEKIMAQQKMEYDRQKMECEKAMAQQKMEYDKQKMEFDRQKMEYDQAMAQQKMEYDKQKMAEDRAMTQQKMEHEREFMKIWMQMTNKSADSKK